RAGRDSTDHSKRGVFLQSDPMISAMTVRPKPIYARDQLDDLELVDLMIKPADLGLFQLGPPPFLRVAVAQGFDDLLDLAARGHPLLLQQQKRFLGGHTSLAGVRKHAN